VAALEVLVSGVVGAPPPLHGAVVAGEVSGKFPLVVAGSEALEDGLLGVVVARRGEGQGSGLGKAVVFALAVVAEAHFMPALVEGGDDDGGGEDLSFVVGGDDAAGLASRSVPSFAVELSVALGLVAVPVVVDREGARRGVGHVSRCSSLSFSGVWAPVMRSAIKSTRNDRNQSKICILGARVCRSKWRLAFCCWAAVLPVHSSSKSFIAAFALYGARSSLGLCACWAQWVVKAKFNLGSINSFFFLGRTRFLVHGGKKKKNFHGGNYLGF
jgi:hypothetical protein